MFKKAVMKENEFNLFVGRVGLEKCLFFNRCFLKISAKISNVHLTIIGDGPERKTVEKSFESWP